MDRNAILRTIENLSFSQGFYSRLYANLLELMETDKQAFNDCMEYLENQGFNDPIDLILFLEV